MKLCVTIYAAILLSSISAYATDATKATPHDVYTLVQAGYNMLKVMGEEGLSSFNDPKGQFVFKDTYAYVMKCPAEMAAHPFAMAELKGVDLRKFPQTEPCCKMAQNPRGGWLEYSWPKPGETAPSRKITFVIGIEGTPYVIASGIFDNSASIEELNKTLR